MRRTRAPHAVFPGAGVVLAAALLACSVVESGDADRAHAALELLLAQQATAGEAWQNPCDADAEAETRVYKLAATEELQRLMERLLADPFTLSMEETGISIVVVAKPLPCGERLLAAQVELWDSLALERRGGAARFFSRLTDWYGRRRPALWQIVFPDEAVARKAQGAYRLTRRLEFDRNSPWMSTVNGYGVVAFPLASSDLSGAVLTFKTERLVAGESGKKPRRVVARRRSGSVALPGPDSPLADPGEVRSALGIDRKP